MLLTQLTSLFFFLHVSIGASVTQPLLRASLERSRKPDLSSKEINKLLHEYSARQTSHDNVPGGIFGAQVPLTGTKRKSPSVPLFNLFGEQYVFNVRLGTPPQTFRVLPDISFSELWVLGKAAGLVFCHDHGCYDSSGSSTFKPNSSKYSWTDPDPFTLFPFTGRVSMDTLNVAGINATNQTFGVLEMGDRIDFAFYFEYQPNDGLFGLSPQKYSKKNGVLSPIYNLVSQTPKHIFSLYLGGEPGSSDSEIIFGGVDSKHFSGDLHEMSALKGHDNWAVKVDGLFAGNESVSLDSDTYLEFATADSSIGLPGNLFAYFESRVVPEDPEEACAARSKMPDLIFELSGKNYTLTADDYLIEIFDDYCISRFYPTDRDMNEPPRFVLGLSFLTKYYSVYDLEEHKISLALGK